MKKRKEILRPWWYRSIRGMHFLAFKYWWQFLFVFFILFGLWIYFCFLPFCRQNNCCSENDYRTRIRELISKIDVCCNCSSNNIIDYDEVDELRKNYGGSVGEVTITLVWKTTDDLDLHLIEPTGDTINFRNPISSSGGQLDVDKNADEMLTSNPIENIYYQTQPVRGNYSVGVHYFSQNSENNRIPYTVIVKIGNDIKEFQGTHVRPETYHTVYNFSIP